MKTIKHEEGKGKRVKEYKLSEEDMKKLLNGESLFFYQGKEIDIYIKLADSLLKKGD